MTNFFAYNPHDTAAIRFEKFAIFLMAGACSVAGVVWTLMYYLVFGWNLTTFLPISFSLIVGTSLVISHFTQNHYIAIYAQIICILYITAFIQWSIGSVFDSGAVLVWAFLGPICALMFFSVRQSGFWFALYMLNLGITVVFDDRWSASGKLVTENTQLFFFGANLGLASTVVFIFSSYYVKTAIKEQDKASKLLETNLQQEIALRQNDRLATLGQLSAGVAHELNNPAAAAMRGTAHLRDAIEALEQISLQSIGLQPGPAQLAVIESETQQVRQRAKTPLDIDPLTRSDREYEIETWLEERGINEAWAAAPMLVSIGYDCNNLAGLAEQFSGDAFNLVTKLLSQRYLVYQVLEEISQGTGRIAEIVKSLKSYSYLDQAPTQSVDIHIGLNDTLILLGSKLKSGIEVTRDYDPAMPHIEAFGSELNQVWTNIIDNAIDAMHGKGAITIKTYHTATCVVVEIADNGPGIPVNIQEKIFDPFFTTKAPGEGTGLGLNISHNIITKKHKGRITVNSSPGKTCFQIKLPMNYEAPNLNT